MDCKCRDILFNPQACSVCLTFVNKQTSTPATGDYSKYAQQDAADAKEQEVAPA